MEMTIMRRKQFFGFAMPTKISIYDKEGKLVCKRRIWSGRTVKIQLQKQDYIVTFSNKILMSRNISTSVTIQGSAADKVWIELEIAHIHLLAMVIPFLAMIAPLFDYRAIVMYDGKLPVSHREKRQRISLLALPFLLMSLLCLMMTISVLVSQLFVSDPVEIQQWELEGTDAYTKYTYNLLGQMMGGAFVFPILIVLIALFYLLYRKINSHQQRGRRREADENAPAIIYLRSFQDDRLTAKEVDLFLRPGVSEEEALVSVLDDIAPVLGVGRPNEKYLPDGAACIVVTDERWHEKVAELAQKAELAVLRLGSTEGVLWELQYCLENLDLKKLLLILPNSRSAFRPDDILVTLRQRGIDLEGVYTGKRGSKGSIWGVLYFDDNRQPVCRPLRMTRGISRLMPLEDRMKEALSGILSRFGLKTKKRRSSAAAALFCVAALVLSVSVLGNAYFSFKLIEHDRFPHDLIESVEEMEDVEKVIAKWDGKDQADYLFWLFINGLMYQEEERIKLYYVWETELMNRMNSREYELLMESYDAYSIRLLTLMKKYFSDEEYDACIAFMTECIALCKQKQEEQPEYGEGFEERAQEATKELQPMVETIALHKKNDKTWEEALTYERQFRALLLTLGDEGYDIMPEIIIELSQTGMEWYEECAK